MIRFLLIVLTFLLVTPIISLSQGNQVLELTKKIPGASVQLETETAFISFYKDDLLLTLELLKGTCGSVNKEWETKCSDAILILKESKNRIDIEENHRYETSELNSLRDLLKTQIAVGLILHKKAKVIRKDSGENQSKIFFKLLTTEGLNYVFSFTDQTVFFKGEISCTVDFQ